MTVGGSGRGGNVVPQKGSSRVFRFYGLEKARMLRLILWSSLSARTSFLSFLFICCLSR